MHLRVQNAPALQATRVLRLRVHVVRLSLSLSSMMAKKKHEKKWPREIVGIGSAQKEGAFLHTLLSNPQVFIHVIHNGLSKEGLLIVKQGQLTIL